MNLKKNKAAAVARCHSQVSMQTTAKCRFQVSIRVVLTLLICCAIGVAIAVGYPLMNHSHSAYVVKVYEIDANKFGYKIMRDERTVVMQPFVPGIPGKRFFTSPDDARRVGELVRERLETDQEFSVTPKDLQQLGVKF